MEVVVVIYRDIFFYILLQKMKNARNRFYREYSYAQCVYLYYSYLELCALYCTVVECLCGLWKCRFDSSLVRFILIFTFAGRLPIPSCTRMDIQRGRER